MRLIGGLTPKKVFVDLRDQVITLKSLAFVEIGVLKRRRLFTLSLESGDLFFQAVLAPVGKLSVKIVLTGINRKRRVCSEIIIEKSIDITIPIGFGDRRSIYGLIYLRFRLTGGENRNCGD